MRLVTILPVSFWVYLALLSLAWFAWGLGGVVITALFALLLVMV